MMIRIYDIAKKLGLETKTVLAKARELGIAGATLPSSSLEEGTARSLEQHLDGCRNTASSPQEAAPEPAATVAQAASQTPETKAKVELLEAFRAEFWPAACEHESHVLLTLAESYLAVARFDEAARILAKIIRAEPTNALAHYRIGDAYWCAGRLEEAIENFAEAEDLDLTGKLLSDAVDQIVQGPLKGRRGIEVLIRVAAKHPKNLGIKYSLAWAYKLDDQLTEAAEHFRDLLSVDLPNDGWRADIEFELSWVLKEKGDLATSVALVEKALPRLGTQWNRREVEEGLAQDYLDLGRLEDGAKIYLRWLEDATPSVGLTGQADAPHPRGDLRTYEMVKKGLLRTLDAARVRSVGAQDGADFFVNRLSPTTLGKLHLALSRCYEETGDACRAEQAYGKAMPYFGELGECPS